MLELLEELLAFADALFLLLEEWLELLEEELLQADSPVARQHASMKENNALRIFAGEFMRAPFALSPA